MQGWEDGSARQQEHQAGGSILLEDIDYGFLDRTSVVLWQRHKSLFLGSSGPRPSKCIEPESLNFPHSPYKISRNASDNDRTETTATGNSSRAWLQAYLLMKPVYLHTTT